MKTNTELEVSIGRTITVDLEPDEMTWTDPPPRRHRAAPPKKWVLTRIVLRYTYRSGVWVTRSAGVSGYNVRKDGTPGELRPTMYTAPMEIRDRIDALLREHLPTTTVTVRES